MGVTCMRDKIDVYLAKIPLNTDYSPLYPSDRNDEIWGVKNQKVKSQKYWVWKLLEHALKSSFGINIEDVEFFKTKSGKWLCDKCCFSLSHSENVVAVAVYNQKVGVDIELIREIDQDAVIKRLTESEKEQLSNLSPDVRQRFLIEKWSQKESIFKSSDNEIFLPSKIDTTKKSVLSKLVVIDQKEYVLSIASENIYDIDLKEIDEI